MNQAEAVILEGDVLEQLARLEDASVSCVVTSPPYWGLRKYDAPDVVWGDWIGQYGQEETPEAYVEHTLMWLRAVRRVIRDDGVLWLNLGDGYQAKQLVLMPSRVALAVQADGWWVRSDIIWHKPNAMPSSVKDRPTTDFEHIFMFTKKARYWYDQEAVREPLVKGSAGSSFTEGKTGIHQEGRASERPREDNPAGRNLRTVWKFATARNSDVFKSPNVLPDGSVYKASPDCSVHGQRTGEGSDPAASGDAPQVGAQPDSEYNGGDPAPVQIGEPLPTPDLGVSDHPEPTPDSMVGSKRTATNAQRPTDDGKTSDHTSCSAGEAVGGDSDSLRPQCSLPASDHSKESRKTGRVPSTTSPCIVSAGTSGRTVDNVASPAMAAEAARTSLNSSGVGYVEGERGPGLSVQRASGTVGKCTCPSHYTTSHFATFPEELPRRSIKAACPPEICAKCGIARVRTVEKKASVPARENYAGRGEVPVHRGGGDRPGGYYPDAAKTTGWTDCVCAEPDYQPGVVLDPFAGIGTTGVVALQLGRDFIGIELSSKYAEMARGKLAKALN